MRVMELKSQAKWMSSLSYEAMDGMEIRSYDPAFRNIAILRYNFYLYALNS